MKNQIKLLISKLKSYYLIASKFIQHVIDSNTEEDSGLVPLLSKLFVAVGIATCFIFILDVVLSIAGKQDVIGVFGDFFGGFLNPILTFFTFFGVILTIVIQSRELRLTKNEHQKSAESLALQTFENTFFNMMDLHNKSINELSVDINELGKDLSEAYEPETIVEKVTQGNLVGMHLPSKVVEKHYTGRKVFSEVVTLLSKLNDNPESTLENYKIINKEHNYLFGHYFRNLYQILKHIDNSKVSEKDKYTAYLRAQLSSFELALLFLNCLDDIVDDGRFRQLVKKYNLLEHLPIITAEKGDDGVKYSFVKYEFSIANQRMITQYIIDEKLSEKTAKHKYGAFGSNPDIADIVEYHL
ncbi:putative phage abortive infection protein [Vibrio coralliilyticus]|uniref:putative phage abortive infection protein n=1 Tax=Vibrio coralliilyticus TaxID=190893 RepID=UPI000C166DB1|nr:putative phage abortive infection protein [Vibrio coralliilyticus]